MGPARASQASPEWGQKREKSPLLRSGAVQEISSRLVPPVSIGTNWETTAGLPLWLRERADSPPRPLVKTPILLSGKFWKNSPPFLINPVVG